jgi:hypothetical protein
MRRYLISHNQDFRITVDKNINFYNPLKTIYDSYLLSNKIILELKFDVDKRNIANKVFEDFPFRITKRSKYIIGVNYLKSKRIF